MSKNWFTIKKIAPNIWGIGEFSHFEKVISYLFVGDNRAMLFDSGMGIGQISNVIKKITRLPILVINSHCHYDHIGGNKEFDNIAIFKSNWSIKIASLGYNHKQLLQFTDKNQFVGPPPQTFNPKIFKIPSFKPSKLLKDKEILEITPFCFKVIHTPGHSPDSICLFEKNSRILLSGDTIYLGPIYLFFPESNIDDYKNSIKKINKLNDISNILPGHNNFMINPNIVEKIQHEVRSIKQKGIIRLAA